jgi:hypothetical protein
MIVFYNRDGEILLSGTDWVIRKQLCIRNTEIANKTHFKAYDVFYSQYSHQHGSAAIAAIFRVLLLLQQYNGTDVVSCVAVSP